MSSLKVVILGDPGVGKTTAIRAFAEHVSALTGTDQTATAIDDGADAAAPLVHLAGMRDRVQGLKLVPLELRGGAQVVFCECSARAAAGSASRSSRCSGAISLQTSIASLKSEHTNAMPWRAIAVRAVAARGATTLGAIAPGAAAGREGGVDGRHRALAERGGRLVEHDEPLVRARGRGRGRGRVRVRVRVWVRVRGWGYGLGLGLGFA